MRNRRVDAPFAKKTAASVSAASFAPGAAGGHVERRRRSPRFSRSYARRARSRRRSVRVRACTSGGVRAPGSAGLTALILGPIAYSFFQVATNQGLFKNVLGEPWFEMHYLTQVLAAFAVVFTTMIIITLVAPLAEPRKLPVRKDIALETEPIDKWAAFAVIAGVAVLFVIFR